MDSLNAQVWWAFTTRCLEVLHRPLFPPTLLTAIVFAPLLWSLALPSGARFKAPIGPTLSRKPKLGGAPASERGCARGVAACARGNQAVGGAAKHAWACGAGMFLSLNALTAVSPQENIEELCESPFVADGRDRVARKERLAELEIKTKEQEQQISHLQVRPPQPGCCGLPPCNTACVQQNSVKLNHMENKNLKKERAELREQNDSLRVSPAAAASVCLDGVSCIADAAFPCFFCCAYRWQCLVLRFPASVV